MEIDLKPIKTGRINKKKLHAVVHAGEDIRPGVIYPASANKLLEGHFVLDSKVHGETTYDYNKANTNDLGVVFKGKTSLKGIDLTKLKVQRVAFNCWLRRKDTDNRINNQAVSLNFGHRLVTNLRHNDAGFSDTFEIYSGGKYITSPHHNVNDGNWHFLTLNMDMGKAEVLLDGKQFWTINNALSGSSFTIPADSILFVKDGSGSVEYSQISFYKNTISLATHQRWYNTLKEHYTSNLQ